MNELEEAELRRSILKLEKYLRKKHQPEVYTGDNDRKITVVTAACEVWHIAPSLLTELAGGYHEGLLSSIV
jgi:hypothetical protein